MIYSKKIREIFLVSLLAVGSFFVLPSDCRSAEKEIVAVVAASPARLESLPVEELLDLFWQLPHMSTHPAQSVIVPPTLISPEELIGAIEEWAAALQVQLSSHGVTIGNQLYAEESSAVNPDGVLNPDYDTSAWFYNPEAVRIAQDDYAVNVYFSDVHGDIHYFIFNLLSLIRMGLLNNDLTVIDESIRISITGDLVDYGPYSMYSLFLANLLLKRNPENVFILRGNHECFRHVNTHSYKRGYSPAFGFYDELDLMFGAGSEAVCNILRSLSKLFPLMNSMCLLRAEVEGQTTEASGVLFVHGTPPEDFVVPGEEVAVIETKNVARNRMLWGDIGPKDGVYRRQGAQICELGPVFVNDFLRRNQQVAGLGRGHTHCLDSIVIGTSLSPLQGKESFSSAGGGERVVTVAPTPLAKSLLIAVNRVVGMVLFCFNESASGCWSVLPVPKSFPKGTPDRNTYLQIIPDLDENGDPGINLNVVVASEPQPINPVVFAKKEVAAAESERDEPADAPLSPVCPGETP
jgi:hypothetical protein